MAMNEMVDDAARAICTRRNIYGDDCIARNEAGTVTCGCGRREAFEADARAVITAMREPTPAVLAAMRRAIFPHEGLERAPVDYAAVYTAAIDELLKD
jgi:hypothetical protein